jgi:aspartyl-tRNA(Asn)/glutamyl-tRNA(Gln) amidotransferase subunit C
MPLTKKEISDIARLARLQLSEAELTLFSSQLSDILEYADRLSQVDLAQADEIAGILPDNAPLRDDIPGSSLSLEQSLGNAASTEGRQFKVPPVLDV